ATGGDAPTAGLSLTASLPTTTGGSLPDWFAPTADPWVLSFSVDTEGAVEFGFEGGAEITIGDDDPFEVTVAVGVATDGTDTTFSLDATIGAIPDLFGQTWLDLEGVALDVDYSTADGFSGGIEATFDLENLTGQDATANVALSFATGS